MTRRPTILAVAAASVLLLTGCASAAGASGAPPEDERVDVVASTNVYGQIAQVVGGDAVEVSSIIDSAAQDPHSYEASARDQLTLRRADLVIENGGGYDAFVEGLIGATGSEAKVLTAVEFSPDWPGASAHDDSDTGDNDETGAGHDETGAVHDEDEHGHDHIAGFNEHVWYDLHAMSDLAKGIASELGTLRPAGADTFEANAAAFAASLEELEGELGAIDHAHGGTHVFVTEPVPLYLTEAAGLVDVTPDAFSEAVEEGQDVPPATLLEALHLLGGGGIRAVIVNSQTGGVETDAVIDAAKKASIPVLEFSEVLPDGLTYVEWMQRNIDSLTQALDA